MKKKELSLSSIEKFADETIIRDAEEKNTEFGLALKKISDKELRNILREGRGRSSRVKFKERIIWSVSVAALLGVAISLPLGIERNARHKIDNMMALFIAPEISETRGGERNINVMSLSEKNLRENIEIWQNDFNASETSQKIAINGRRLVCAYFRIHDRRGAKEILEIMTERLKEDEDYVDVVNECRMILEQMK